MLKGFPDCVDTSGVDRRSVDAQVSRSFDALYDILRFKLRAASARFISSSAQAARRASALRHFHIGSAMALSWPGVGKNRAGLMRVVHGLGEDVGRQMAEQPAPVVLHQLCFARL